MSHRSNAPEALCQPFLSSAMKGLLRIKADEVRHGSYEILEAASGEEAIKCCAAAKKSTWFLQNVRMPGSIDCIALVRLTNCEFDRGFSQAKSPQSMITAVGFMLTFPAADLDRLGTLSASTTIHKRSINELSSGVPLVYFSWTIRAGPPPANLPTPPLPAISSELSFSAPSRLTRKS